MDAAPLTIEFFHDVLSCWCFNASERVRALVREHPEIQVIHRSWPLGTDPGLFRRMFPDMRAAKQEILMEHWADAVKAEGEDRIRPELMLSREFDYPWSMPSQRGCKAAEKQAGQQGHWDFFDRAQRAHLTDCDNVADPEVLTRCAREVGLDVNQWLRDFEDPHRDIEVGMDLGIARAYGVIRVPLLVAEGGAQLHGEAWSTFGYRITAERLARWHQDLRLARRMGRI
jgi:putative protein-disulfide isomerase